jgi:hypothetical protein
MGFRFPIDPRMVPAPKVARRLGLTVAAFEERLPALIAAGFPRADDILGTYCLQAVDNWIDERAGLQPRDPQINPVADMKSAIRAGAWGK